MALRQIHCINKQQKCDNDRYLGLQWIDPNQMQFRHFFHYVVCSFLFFFSIRVCHCRIAFLEWHANLHDCKLQSYICCRILSCYEWKENDRRKWKRIHEALHSTHKGCLWKIAKWQTQRKNELQKTNEKRTKQVNKIQFEQ